MWVDDEDARFYSKCYHSSASKDIASEYLTRKSVFHAAPGLARLGLDKLYVLGLEQFQHLVYLPFQNVEVQGWGSVERGAG